MKLSLGEAGQAEQGASTALPLPGEELILLNPSGCWELTSPVTLVMHRDKLGAAWPAEALHEFFSIDSCPALRIKGGLGPFIRESSSRFGQGWGKSSGGMLGFGSVGWPELLWGL